MFTYRDPTTDDILLETVEDGKTEVLVKMSNLVTRKLLIFVWRPDELRLCLCFLYAQQLDQGHLEVASFEISGDAEYLLLWTNVTSVMLISGAKEKVYYKLTVFCNSNGDTPRDLISMYTM